MEVGAGKKCPHYYHGSWIPIHREKEGEEQHERGRGIDIYGSKGVNQDKDSVKLVSIQLIEGKNMSLVSE